MGTGRTIWIKVSKALPQRSCNQTRNRFFTTKITKNTKFESIKKSESFVAFVRFVVRSDILTMNFVLFESFGGKFVLVAVSLCEICLWLRLSRVDPGSLFRLRSAGS